MSRRGLENEHGVTHSAEWVVRVGPRNFSSVDEKNIRDQVLGLEERGSEQT